MIHRFDKFNQRLRLTNTIVDFQCRERCRVCWRNAAFTQAIDRPLIGLLAIHALGFAAGKDANVWRTEEGSVIDPLHIGNLRVALRAIWQGKIIADGGAADIHAAQKRVLPSP